MKTRWLNRSVMMAAAAATLAGAVGCSSGPSNNQQQNTGVQPQPQPTATAPQPTPTATPQPTTTPTPVVTNTPVPPPTPQPTYTPPPPIAPVIAQLWYDVYGTLCASGTPRAGCNFYSDGYKIKDAEDPYFRNGYYSLTYAQWVYTNSYGYQATFNGYAWLSPDGIVYDDYGNALNNLDDSSGGRDMMGDVVQAEENMILTAGRALSAKYALAEETGIKIARSLNGFATLSKKEGRGRTQDDVKQLTENLLGVKYEDAQKAIDQASTGDLSGVTALNQQVAASWSTSPETSQAMLKTFFKAQLAQAQAQAKQ